MIWMRSILLLLLFPFVSAGQEPETPRAFVERAVKAIGGEDKLKQLRAVHREYEIKAPNGRLLKFKQTTAFPGQVRMEQEIWDEGDAKPTTFLHIINQTRSYGRVNDEKGKIEDATQDELTKFQRGNRAGWLARILPLKDSAYELSWLKDDVIDKSAVKVMLVKHAEMPDVKLSFDPKTALLLQSEYRTFMGKEERLLRTQFADYRDIDGILMAKKYRTIIDKQMPSESVCNVVRWFSKIDEKWFAFPEK